MLCDLIISTWGLSQWPFWHDQQDLRAPRHPSSAKFPWSPFSEKTPARCGKAVKPAPLTSLVPAETRQETADSHCATMSCITVRLKKPSFPATIGWRGNANKSSLVGRLVAFGRPSVFPWSLKEVRTGALESRSYPSVRTTPGWFRFYSGIPNIKSARQLPSGLRNTIPPVPVPDPTSPVASTLHQNTNNHPGPARSL